MIASSDNTLSSLHLRAMIAYQPASRFWVLQWYETRIFLAAAQQTDGTVKTYQGTYTVSKGVIVGFSVRQVS